MNWLAKLIRALHDERAAELTRDIEWLEHQLEERDVLIQKLRKQRTAASADAVRRRREIQIMRRLLHSEDDLKTLRAKYPLTVEDKAIGGFTR